MSEDPFASYRPLLRSAKLRAIDSLDFSHAAPLRQQLAHPDETSDLPALCCLLAAEVASDEPEQALPAATALALLGEMERVFSAIAGEGEDGLEANWGMPRTLNAGDAFFNLAQAVLLKANDGSDSGRQVLLTTCLDKACRAYAESLFERSPSAKRRVVSAAIVLGALAAGAEESMADQLAGFAFDPDDERTALAGLSADGREKLSAAGRYLAEVGL